MSRRKFQKFADWQATNATPAHVGPSLIVTATDRNGRVHEQRTIFGTTEMEIIAERGDIHDELRAKYPDCQIWYDWKRG